MIAFQQTPDTFFVTEQLLYPISGTGRYTFCRIQKKDCSTREAKQRISEMTGVPIKHINHAGMKDTAATAVQWFSWPKNMTRREPTDTSKMRILEISAHENTLSIGHVARNQFELILQCDQPDPDLERLNSQFPNYYGPQRFAGKQITYENLGDIMARPSRQTGAAVPQSFLFNEFLRSRIESVGTIPNPDDLWSPNNGKRCFAAEWDDDLQARYDSGAIAPTGPIYGYKMKTTPNELTFLAEAGLETESFRAWGKSARGARRPLFIKPQAHILNQSDGKLRLSLTLPTGAYATVYLLHLFVPDLLKKPYTFWPNFLNQVVFEGASLG